MVKSITILNKTVGDGYPTFIIGEIGLNHNGSIEIAKKLIDIAAKAGCDCVKFQKRDVDNLATKEVLDAEDNRFPEFGRTYRQIRERHEFGEADFRKLMAYAQKRNIAFLCSAFDITSANFLKNLGVQAYKLASHTLTNVPLLEYVANLRKPTILSTGMAKLKEVDQAVKIFKKRGCPLVILHCISSYPQPAELSNLKLIDFYKNRYGLPVGYSGHELGYIPTLGAIFRGANMIERHITLDTNMVGFDHKLSLTPKMLTAMIKDIRIAETALGTGKKALLEEELITRRKYHVSVVSKVPIKRGMLITKTMLTFKNPGTGIPAYKVDKVIGKKAKQDIPEDTLISFTMLK